MANEKMTEYYKFGKETVIYELLSGLDEEAREDYLEGFDELDDETEQKVELFVNQFVEVVYAHKQNVIAKVTNIDDDSVELCVTEL